MVSIYRKLSCIYAGKQSTTSLTSFLRYCKEIAHLLFWVIWACLATKNENDKTNLKKPLMFNYRQKINFIFMFLLIYLHSYWKLVILATLGIPGYTYQKWYYQLVENFCVYLQAKNQLHHPCFLDTLQRYANFLFWVLCACLATHTQYDCVNLYNNSMLI